VIGSFDPYPWILHLDRRPVLTKFIRDYAKMYSMFAFPYVDAGPTDHAGLGLAIGEHLREPIRVQCDKVVRELSRRTVRVSLSQVADDLLAYGSRFFPQYVEEIEGMAAGAGINFRHMLLTSCEESALSALRERCTTIAFSALDCTVLGHNEDWAPGFEDSFYVVRAQMPDGLSFLSLAYIGSPPGSSVALNSHGIAFSGNSLLGLHQPGIAKNLLLRSQVEARSLRDFERRATRRPRAISNNTMALDRSGHVVNIEMGLMEHAVLHPDEGVLVHTNHVLAPQLEHLEKFERPCSHRRFATARDLASAAPPSKELMRDILLSHDGWPHSVCLHAATEHYDDAQTVASAIVDLSDMSLEVAKGPPCAYRYQAFRLAA